MLQPLAPTFEAAGHTIGPDQRVLVIAEAGVNHNGDPRMARELVDAAAAAGADAVKFQTFAAERLVTRTAPKAAYQLQTTAAAESQFEMLEKLELSAQAHGDLCAYARSRNLVFLSTPFDAESADLLATLDVPLFKMGSGELTDLPLLTHVAAKGRPMLLSTGMSWLDEVELAVKTVAEAGQHEIALLHCVSSYPARAEDVNLRALDTLRALHVPVGYSDHTDGIAMPIAAVARGACIIEKHFTLDRRLPGPDQRSSLEPAELAAMIRGIREMERALGDGVKRPMPSELNTRAVARKSVVALVDIARGQLLTSEVVGIRRPGTGIAPVDLDRVLGRASRIDLPAGAVLTWDVLV